jgi:hypothetical protein
VFRHQQQQQRVQVNLRVCMITIKVQEALR